GRQPAEVRPADLAEKRRDRLEIVDRDVARDVDRVAAQEIPQKADLHRLPLDVVENRLGQIFRADPIVPRVVEPRRLRQLVRERRLTDAGHAEQRDRLVRPLEKLLACHSHIESRRRNRGRRLYGAGGVGPTRSPAVVRPDEEPKRGPPLSAGKRSPTPWGTSSAASARGVGQADIPYAC